MFMQGKQIYVKSVEESMRKRYGSSRWITGIFSNGSRA